MRFNSKRWRDYLAFSLTGATLSGLTVYLVGHLAFAIPIERLISPFCAFVALFASSAPLIYWARSYAISERADFRQLFFSTGLVCLVACLLAAFYGARLGLLDPHTAKGYAVTCALGGPFGILLGYYAHKNIYGKIHCRQGLR